MIKLVIGIDLDDTLIETSKLANKILHENDKYKDLEDFHLLKHSEYQKFLKKHIKDIQENVELKEQAIEVLKWLKEKNFSIVIITARGSKGFDFLIPITEKYLISKIEEMLEISREDINLKLPEESTGGKTGKSKWLYKNVYYDNAKLVRALIQDYIVDKGIKNYIDIPEDIRNYKMYSHELIIDEKNELLDNYSYTKVEANGMNIYVRSICQKNDTNEFIDVLKNYYSFNLETVDNSEE